MKNYIFKSWTFERWHISPLKILWVCTNQPLDFQIYKNGPCVLTTNQMDPLCWYKSKPNPNYKPDPPQPKATLPQAQTIPLPSPPPQIKKLPVRFNIPPSQPPSLTLSPSPHGPCYSTATLHILHLPPPLPMPCLPQLHKVPRSIYCSLSHSKISTTATWDFGAKTWFEGWD